MNLDKNTFWFFIVFLVLIFIDQATKKIVLEGFRFKFLFFEITLIYNEGSAFGIKLLENYQYILVNSFILVLFLVYFIYKYRHGIFKKLHLTWFVFIFSGAIGNLIDRLIHGKVIDFISIYVFPVFNFADIWISIGMIVFIFSILREK